MKIVDCCWKYRGNTSSNGRRCRAGRRDNHMNRLERIQRSLVKKTVPSFEIGDTVKVHVKVIEGEKERIQVFEGVVIARKGARNSETFTVRKISYGVGVERIFPIVSRIDVVRRGKARRAKLYYLRERKGKTARLSDREFSAETKGQSPGVR